MRRHFILFLTLMILLSCENDTSSIVKMGLEGVAQKGPFITGSSIQIQELNENFSPNGVSYNISTEDNFGSFNIESEIGTDFIEIISTGFFFNEVSGEVTNTNLTLRALSPVEEVLNCNINILTTLAKKRIVYLINEENRTYYTAKTQAQLELLNIFSINESEFEDFEKMDISENGDSNGILLAISAILQGDNTVSELSALISTIIEDIKTDGILDNIDAKNEIVENAKYLSLPSVRENIETRYNSLGLNNVIPDFEKYVNNIWSNNSPTCSLNLQDLSQGYPVNLEDQPIQIGSNVIATINSNDIDGKISKYELYIDNALASNFSTYYWTITDTTKYHTLKALVYDDDGAIAIDSLNYETSGYQWIRTTSNAPWRDTEMQGVALNDVLYCYNLDKIYSSANGIDWNLVSDNMPWNDYFGILLNTEFDDKMWMVADNKIWNSSDGLNWVNLNIQLPDGYSRIFIYKNELYLHGSDSKIYKISGDTLVQISPTLVGGWPIVVIENDVYLFNNGKVIHSQDLINWVESSTSITWDSWLGFFIGYNNKILLFDGNDTWESTDGVEWNKSIPNPQFAKGSAFIRDNTLWYLEASSNVYYLKKYFD